MNAINAGTALKGAVSLNEVFGSVKDPETQTVTLKEDLTLTAPDGTTTTLPANTEITLQNPSKNGSDGFLATGDISRSQNPINREISHEGYSKMGWGIAQAGAQTKSLVHEVGEGSSFITNADGSFPKGAKLSDGTDIGGYKIDVPEGTDVVQMVEVGGKVVMLPLDLDLLDLKGSDTEAMNKKGSKTVTYNSVQLDEKGDFLKQYDGLKELGVGEEAIESLADDAREIKDSQEYETLSKKGMDKANEGIDAVKKGGVPDIPGIKND